MSTDGPWRTAVSILHEVFRAQRHAGRIMKSPAGAQAKGKTVQFGQTLIGAGEMRQGGVVAPPYVIKTRLRLVIVANMKFQPPRLAELPVIVKIDGL